MQVSREDIDGVMKQKSDDELRAVLFSRSHDYTPEAIQSAREEFQRRDPNEMEATFSPTKPQHSVKKRGWWNRYWPDVNTEAGARVATRRAFWAAVWVAGLTAVFAVLGSAGIGFARLMGLDAWALVDAVLFGAIAMGLWRRSRWAAWGGLLLYILEIIDALRRGGMKNPIVTAIFVLMFVGGVRGTTSLARLTEEEMDGATNGR